MKIVATIYAILMFGADIVIILRFANMLKLRKKMLREWEKRPLGDTAAAIGRISTDMYIAAMLILTLTYGTFDLIFEWII